MYVDPVQMTNFYSIMSSLKNWEHYVVSIRQRVYFVLDSEAFTYLSTQKESICMPFCPNSNKSFSWFGAQVKRVE